MTTHDIHRTMEDNLFNKFQRHTPMPSSNASISSFPSLTASELIGLLPGTPHQKRQQQQRMARDRPASDILQSHIFNGNNTTKTHITEAEAIDQWFENIQRYELMLEEVAAASLDQTFKDELQHVNQWFKCRSDAERTAALYSVVQNASPIQMRFLIMVLQQLSNQEPFGGLLTSNTQDKDSIILPVAGSVISTESEYERRKRQLYSASHRRNGNNNHINNHHHYNQNNNNRSPIRITSASSEPDDLRRRNRDLFSMGRSSTLGTDHPPLGSTLSQQGLLYEKALAARAQLQAMHNNRNASSSSVSSAASVAANSVNSRLQPILSATTSTPTNDTSGLDNHSNTSSNSSHSGHSALSLDSLQQKPPPPPHPTTSTSSSLFGNDWPFPFTRQNRDRSTLVGRIGDHRSVASSTKSSTIDDAWSFGSLSKKKKTELMDLHSWSSRKSSTIKEEHESSTNSSQEDLSKLPPSSASSPLNNNNNNNNNNILSSLHNSLSTLEQAQARLRAESSINRNWSKNNNIKNHHQNNNHHHNLLISNHPSNQNHVLTTPSSLTTAATNLSNLLSNKSNSNLSPIGNPTIPTQNINNHQLDPKSAYTSPLPTPSLSSTTSNNNLLTSNNHLHSTKELRSSPPLLLSPSSSSKTSSLPTSSISSSTPTSSSIISSSITPTASTSSNVLGSSFLVPPPTVYENEILEISHSTSTENHSDQGEDHDLKEDEQPVLTGTARRRKRSSAARALKDKIAAETIDFELMKDVQNWLRSLRLHKYGHAFIGLQWQQVIKMTDQDMIDAGVNTIGARRKLLKVFENVQRHCNENDIEY